ncbi:MAG: hypothetical protein V4480_03670 [Patescibacteria group bacterium]
MKRALFGLGFLVFVSANGNGLAQPGTRYASANQHMATVAQCEKSIAGLTPSSSAFIRAEHAKAIDECVRTQDRITVKNLLG